MKYTNQEMRRNERGLEEQSAKELLKTANYGVLSLRGEEDGAYGIPLNYAWDGNDAIYFHCALEGRKLRCINLCDKVSFCIVGMEKVIPKKFTTEYQSIILDCKASLRLSEVEQLKALELIVDKYSPEFKEEGMKYAQKALQKTEIVKLTIEQWSGKSKI
ncbi:pyridoxamine 5'-phosphate oxidase family protein [Puteibacter caeruleilacunae]|nr:pyridoxamine 5'-phosphate oxidase family protein [Puteibacter caeruleilacunae]